MVLLGALMQTGVLPFAADTVKEAMKRKTKKDFLDSNLKAFDLGYAEAANAA
jgi:indolepyruvate ferredoxin oxidoreductase beta subunit